MKLSEVLEEFSFPVTANLPNLDRIQSAKNRIFKKWPDVIVEPSESDQAAKIEKLLNHINQNKWENVKKSDVISAIRVAYNNTFRTVDAVKTIHKFVREEVAATNDDTFLSGIVSVYFATFEPSTIETMQLGQSLQSKKNQLPSKWKIILENFQNIFNADKAHLEIGEYMQRAANPWQDLISLGFTNPHADGLLRYAHRSYVNILADSLDQQYVVEKLFNWLHPEPNKYTNKEHVLVIESLLHHWTQNDPLDDLRELITEQLITIFGDPRTNETNWLGVNENILAVMYRWLTKEDLRFFISVVDATQQDPQWQPRKKFWLSLYEEGLIDHAWVAFCPSAERYARDNLVRNGFEMNQKRFGRQSQTGHNRLNTSLLIMKIKDKIFVDGCHNYKTHVFNAQDPVAPKMFLPKYDCEIVRKISPDSKQHSSIPAWQRWVRQNIYSNLAMSPRDPRTPQRDYQTRDTNKPQTNTIKPNTAHNLDNVTHSDKPKTYSDNTLNSDKEKRFAFDVSFEKILEELIVLRDLVRENGLVSKDFDSVRYSIKNRQTLSNTERAWFLKLIKRLESNQYKFPNLMTLSMPIFNTYNKSHQRVWILKTKQLRALAEKNANLSKKATLGFMILETGNFPSGGAGNALEHVFQTLRTKGVSLDDILNGQ